MSMLYLCCDKRRRLLLAEENERRLAASEPLLNGIDYLEVLDRDAPTGVDRQQTLLLRFFQPVPTLGTDQRLILGGERIRPVHIVWAHAADAIPASDAPAAERDFFAGLSEPGQLLVVRTDSSGDHSRYRFVLRAGPDSDEPPDGIDPLFAAVDFSFKVECPNDFDCAATRSCPPEPERPPQINYLAKDYASFRQTMLDRMSVLMPEWKDRNPADLGVTLVELLAAVGDRLSYRQDAIATEAFLDTARRRVSVRRHARLVDYFMHDGCNARAWARIDCAADLAGSLLPEGTPLVTRVLPDRQVLSPGSAELEDVLFARPVVFETMHPLELFGDHREMAFHTWGDGRCCLPKGATRATLRGHLPNLGAGAILVFAEVVNPRTGATVDADRTRRHAVRLTEVSAELGGSPRTDPVTGEEITGIAWDAEDALPFPLCLSAVSDPDHGEAPLADVSLAWGNVVLADHGRSLDAHEIGAVPAARLFRLPGTGDRCSTGESVPIPPRFRPVLPESPLTQESPHDAGVPASQSLKTDPALAVPALELVGDREGELSSWHAARDLLASDEAARTFVVEIEHGGRAFLRFGDDVHGRRPDSGTSFSTARYRVGNGVAGNLGAGSLFHVVTDLPGVLGVDNPLPAGGGVEPEAVETVRDHAPVAFRTQERAVTAADYVDRLEAHPEVQRAAATFRWTGSWHTVFNTIDPLGGVPEDSRQALLEAELLNGLGDYRMAGYDLELDEPRYVSLEVTMRVCVKPGYFRSAVRAALLDVFGAGLRADGRRAVFHPDNFSFGQPVYLSPLYAAAQNVPGVASAHVTIFQRQGQPSEEALQAGRLELDRLEIARLENDPNFPEHGVFQLEIGGGK